MNKIQDIKNFPGLITKKLKHRKYEDLTKLKTPYEFKNNNCLIGIEIEIENIPESLQDSLKGLYWEETEDHSLRNYGREYKSIPLRTYQIPYAIEHLQATLNHTNPEYTFSNRCSVHVHLNVRDFTMEQLACFLILYCVFEKHFFHIAGTKRENNIFCVPLWNTEYIPSTEYLHFPESYTKWHKYLALNCGCIFGSENNQAFGTIEFRHLYGTLDTNILYPWINSIIALREASSKYKLDELISDIPIANTTSQYLHWYSNIFQELRISSYLLTKNNYEYCISNLKQNLFSKTNIHSTNYFNLENNHWFLSNGLKQSTTLKPKESITKINPDILNYIMGITDTLPQPTPTVSIITNQD